MAELTEQEKADLEQRVARGVALLDEKVPDWRERVDVSELQMADCMSCVLGQLFGEYALGVSALGISLDGSERYGVDGPPDHNELMDYLDALWTKEIQR